jgi:hypothetical protein
MTGPGILDLQEAHILWLEPNLPKEESLVCEEFAFHRGQIVQLANRPRLGEQVPERTPNDSIREMQFPVFFPVSREFGLENGSLETPPTAIEYL